MRRRLHMIRLVYCQRVLSNTNCYLILLTEEKGCIYCGDHVTGSILPTQPAPAAASRPHDVVSLEVHSCWVRSHGFARTSSVWTRRRTLMSTGFTMSTWKSCVAFKFPKKVTLLLISFPSRSLPVLYACRLPVQYKSVNWDTDKLLLSPLCEILSARQ